MKNRLRSFLGGRHGGGCVYTYMYWTLTVTLLYCMYSLVTFDYVRLLNFVCLRTIDPQMEKEVYGGCTTT